MLRRLFSALERVGQRQEEKRMGEGECSGARGSPLEAEARGRERGRGGAGGAAGRFEQGEKGGNGVGGWGR